MNNNIDAVRHIVGRSCAVPYDRDKRGAHLLHNAAEHGYFQILLTLLAARANPNATDNESLTPLDYAEYCACRNAERSDACLASAAILIVYGGHRAAPSDSTDQAAAEAQRRQSRELAHRAGAIVPFDDLPWRAAGAPPTTAPTVRGVIVPPPPNPASVEPAPAPAAASHSPLLQDPPQVSEVCTPDVLEPNAVPAIGGEVDEPRAVSSAPASSHQLSSTSGHNAPTTLLPEPAQAQPSTPPSHDPGPLSPQPLPAPPGVRPSRPSPKAAAPPLPHDALPPDTLRAVFALLAHLHAQGAISADAPALSRGAANVPASPAEDADAAADGSFQ